MTGFDVTKKTILSFSSSNTSFSGCVRNSMVSHFPLSFNSYILTDNLELWTEEEFSDNYHKPVLSSTVGQHSFSSCTFTSLTSSDNGGAIYFSSGNSLYIESCKFSNCRTSKPFNDWHGGGAVFINCGTLSIISSIFHCCTTSTYGGGVYAMKISTSSIVLLSSFILCDGDYGGGLMTFWKSTSSVFSSRFLLCTVKHAGGALYHDSDKQTSYFSLSDSLFANNSANYSGTRGGGAFEDNRSVTYNSTYSFCFFRGNNAPNGNGKDISIQDKPITQYSIVHCLTTTTSHSLWNKKYTGFENWLPFGNILNLQSQRMKYTHYSESL